MNEQIEQVAKALWKEFNYALPSDPQYVAKIALAALQPQGDNMLDKIFERQLELQKKSFGVNPAALNDEDRRQFIVDMMLALQDELHEALNETGWKPWATSRHLNRQAFGNELVDALHFLVNLFIVNGWNAENVASAYFAKAEKNALRQELGYDGVAQKCSSCGRALDDVAVRCTEWLCNG